MVGLLAPLAGDEAQEIAARLIAELGSLSAILSADRSRLASLARHDASVSHLLLISVAMRHALRHHVARAPLLANHQAVLDYLWASMALARAEQVRVLFLDANHRLLRDEVLFLGTISHCELHVREVMQRSLELNAAGIVIAHNHPSGNPRPSRADTEATRYLVTAGKTIGVAVLDHVIVGSEGSYSFRSQGLM